MVKKSLTGKDHTLITLVKTKSVNKPKIKPAISPKFKYFFMISPGMGAKSNNDAINVTVQIHVIFLPPSKNSFPILILIIPILVLIKGIFNIKKKF